MRLENDTVDKSQASSYSQVKCGLDGEFRYPSAWPQCSESVTCGDPATSEGVTRTYQTGGGLAYDSVLQYVCTDPRMYIKVTDSTAAIAPLLTSRCQWKKTYPVDGTNLTCEIHHCAHPHAQPGRHEPPPAGHDISLVVPDGWTEDGWRVAFKENITYKCDGDTFIETSDPVELDPTKDKIEVECKNSLGVYDTPVLRGESWPNCTKTINCGPPPTKPTNGFINAVQGFDGYITWLNGAPPGRDTYSTTVEYKCAQGSQFDQDGDGLGETISMTSRCRWDKAWSPPAPLPNCQITHCTKPFQIPFDTYLEEIESNWTMVTQTKKYRCKGRRSDGTHTRFWESDRTKSTFEILCQTDGSYDFDSARSSWPTCVEGKELSCLHTSISTCQT